MRRSSKEYWERQQTLTLLAVEKTEVEFEMDMIKAFQRTQKQLVKEIESFYEKYATKEGISIKQAKAKMATNDVRSFRWRAKRYLTYMEKNKHLLFDPEVRRTAERFSRSAQVGRLEELNFNIQMKINDLFAGVGSEIENNMAQAFADGFYRTLFNAHKQFGMKPNFAVPSRKQLDAAVRQNWSGREFSTRLWTNRKLLNDTLQDVISQEFVRGKGSSDVAQKIHDALGVGINACKRLARTEMNYTANQGTLLAYNEAGLEKYQYLATLDNRTSPECAEKDGEIIPLDKAVVGDNYPPLHPNCRSTTIPYYEDDEIAPLVTDRVARDEEGRTVRLGKNVTFKQWLDEFAPASVVTAFAKRNDKLVGVGEPEAVPEVFDYGTYEVFSEREAIALMKDYYGGADLEHWDMPDVYRDYVRTANSFSMNRILYSGQYDKAKANPNFASQVGINNKIRQIDEFKEYVTNAPNLPKNTKLVRLIDDDAMTAYIDLAVGDRDLAQKMTDDLGRLVRRRREMQPEDHEKAAEDFRSRTTAVTFQANSFISASYDLDKNVFTGRDYLLEIYADKGANSLVTYNHDESEIVFNVGTKLRFLDVDTRSSRDHVIVKMRILPD